MAFRGEEPTPKRLRTEMGSGERFIKLNMANYDRRVQDYSDEDLVKIFEIGLKIKESVVLSVNPKIVEDALNTEMQPVHDSVARMEKQLNDGVRRVKEEVSEEVKIQFGRFTGDVVDLKKDVSNHITDIARNLTNRVDTVAEKVQPLGVLNSSIGASVVEIKTQLQRDLTGSEMRLTEKLDECKGKVDSISKSLEKPSNKGFRAERNVKQILERHLQHLNYTFKDTAKTPGKADIEVETPKGHKIIIEVKARQSAVPKDEIETFEENLSRSPDFKVGILLSMTSGVARRSQEGWFEVTFNETKKQYQIYVPNAYANNEENLIVWSVVMAAQLSNVELELGDKEIEGLKEIYKKFKDVNEHNKKCKDGLVALKNSVKMLEDSIEPILKVIDQTRKDIYKLLHS